MIRYLIIAVAAFEFAWFANGWRSNAEIASIQTERDAEKRKQVEATLAQNRQMLRAFENEAERSRKEKERAKAENDTLRHSVRDGALRLSVAINFCKANNPETGGQQARA